MQKSRTRSNIIYGINSFLERIEGTSGRLFFSFSIGLIFLLVVSLFTSVRWEAQYHATAFLRLSQNPFETGENNLRLRILSPLLGYLLFMRGTLFMYFMLFVLSIFLGLIYYYQRKNFNPVESLGITAILAFSTLTFYQLYFPGYTDPLSYLIILLLINNYKKAVLSTVLLYLLLFNHENNLFLFPFFVLLMVDGKYTIKNLKNIFIRFTIAIIPYLFFRMIVTHFAEVEFTASYYFNLDLIRWTLDHVLPNLARGVFQAFRLSWVLPLFAICINVFQKNGKELLLMFSVIVFVLLQLVIAWDISRLMGMAFPLILISALRLKNYLGSEKFTFLLYVIVALNFFIPSFYVGPSAPIPLNAF